MTESRTDKAIKNSIVTMACQLVYLLAVVCDLDSLCAARKSEQSRKDQPGTACKNIPDKHKHPSCTYNWQEGCF